MDAESEVSDLCETGTAARLISIFTPSSSFTGGLYRFPTPQLVNPINI